MKNIKKLITFILFFSILVVFSQKKYTYIIKNLSINDANNNFSTSFYGNDIVFSSLKGDRLHLYRGKIVNGDVRTKQLFFRTDTHDSDPVFTKDLKTMYFSKSVVDKNTEKSKAKRIAIYRATKSPGGFWTNIVRLPFNSNEYDVGSPALSKDNKKLYFSSNMRGGNEGQTDVFVVDILPNNKFSKPRNLGLAVNSKAHELHLFISDDDKLYFSSNRKGGYGGMDVYVVDLNSNRKAKLLPRPINSNMDDFSYVYNSKKKQGFFSSNRSGGKGGDDIYLFFKKEIIKEKEVVVKKEIKKPVRVRKPVVKVAKKENKKPKVTKVVKKTPKKETLPIKAVSNKKENYTIGCNRKLIGRVYLNATQRVVGNALVKLKNSDGEIIKEYQTNNNAKFNFTVKCNRKYKIEGSNSGFTTSERVFVTRTSDNPIINKNVFLTPQLKDGEKREYVLIGTIDFEYNKWKLLPQYTYELDKAATAMKKNKRLSIYFESHTDSRAATDFNMKLSEKRIRVLKEYLGFKKIFRRRIIGSAYGESKPINNCVKGVKCKDEEYLENRRTTFFLKER